MINVHNAILYIFIVVTKTYKSQSDLSIHLTSSKNVYLFKT